MSLLQRNQIRSSPSSRLRVGDCVVDVPLREVVRADGSGTRITAKAMAVLLQLATHPGQVVGRDALLESVWAGTLPTDDVLTQAITVVRKAFGDDREAPMYVETIPKSGYRLLAAVEWLPDGGPAGATGHRGRQLLAWSLGIAAVAAMAWFVAFRTGPAAPAGNGEPAYTLLTSRVGMESQPALSPDGAQVAYAVTPGTVGEPAAIFVQASQPIPPRQLTVPPAGSSDHLPRWSPDGRQVMFTRVDEGGRCEFHLLPASGGASRAIGPCDRLNGRYDWLPDGSGIVAGLLPGGDRDSAPLSALHLATGKWQPIQYAIGAGEVDFDPRYSPDGSRLGFRRHLSRSDIWEVPARGGTPRRLTHLRGSITGWDWAPDGASLLLGVAGSVPKLYRHDLASGRSRVLGRLGAIGVDLAPGRNVMVFTIDEARIAMFRYPLPLREGSQVQALFPSSGTDLLPSPSPDGQWIAFHSDRSREARLWVGEPDNPVHLRMIEGITPISRNPPQWSADSRKLLVVGEGTDADGATRPVLYEVDVASGRASELALDAVPYFAQYLPGERLLLVVGGDAERLSLRIVDASSVPLRTLATLDDVGEARFDPGSGQVHLVRASAPGLWRTGLELDEPEPVSGELPGGYWLRRWALLDGQPFALRTAAPDCLAQWHWLGPERAAAASASGCLDPGRRGVPFLALMVSQDGRWLYASMVVGAENSDIGLLEFD